MSSTTHTEQAPRGAVRLIVAYDGDRLSLVSQQRVDMALPRPDVRGQPALSPGHYAEVRGPGGETLASVQISEAPTTSVEVFPEEEGGEITRTDVERPQGAFTVVVPVAPDASEVAIVRVPAVEPEGALATAAATEELALFALEPES
jgi:hypothetical protein